jgi:hypothetical protein
MAGLHPDIGAALGGMGHDRVKRIISKLESAQFRTFRAAGPLTRLPAA